MIQSTRYWSTIIIAMLCLTLAACGTTPRPADIAPPLPPATPAPTATSAAVSTPPAAPATSPTPAAAASQPQLDPAAVLITFSISGGLVGFCDSLTVKAGGDYTLQSCKTGASTGVLPQADLDALKGWVSNLASFQFKYEDNPGGPDSMTTELVFNGAGSTQPDDQQKQAVVDWVNGLFIRLRPQQVAPPPTPTPTVVGPAGLCPDIARPAPVVADYNNPGSLFLIDPSSQAQCQITLNPPPYGRILAASSSLYYPVFDPNGQTITLWRLSRDGAQTPLPFTKVSAGQYDRFSFALSADSSKVAWARTAVNPEANPPVYQYSLWLANSDGSNQVTLFDQVSSPDKRYLEPARFSVDMSTLFYALQPGELSGPLFAPSGRYDNIYSIPATGGESRLWFGCPTAENPLCVGDLLPDGSALVFTQSQSAQVQVIDRNGQPLASIAAPATDYVGPAIFGSTGKLAFISATLKQVGNDQPAQPNPGIISLVEPPYTGQPRTLVSGNNVAMIWEWLDETRLAYGSLDEFGNVGTSIVTLEGQITELSPNYALAVLR